jgi:hypothetical protein
MFQKRRCGRNDTVVIPKNHIGHISVITNFYNKDLCVEGGIRATRQMVPRCLVSTDDQGRAMVPMMNLSGDDYAVNKSDKVTRGVLFAETKTTETQREVNTELVTEYIHFYNIFHPYIYWVNQHQLLFFKWQPILKIS